MEFCWQAKEEPQERMWAIHMLLGVLWTNTSRMSTHLHKTDVQWNVGSIDLKIFT